MVDMHGNSPKSLRQDLLAQRKQFAGSAGYAKTQEAVVTSLTHLLAKHDAQIQSVALYYPIQDELDLRVPLLTWAGSGEVKH